MNIPALFLLTSRLLLTAALLHLSLLNLSSPLQAENFYDTIIRSGTIVDGTGHARFVSDIAIKDDRIVAIQKNLSAGAACEIDANGLIVAPGFIDIHSHSDYLLLEDGHAQSKIRQGVTTEILGEGSSAGPYKMQLPTRTFQTESQRLSWNTLGEYLDILEQQGIATNVASYVGLGNIWRCVMGNSFDRPTQREFSQMKSLLREALEEGAFGLSSMLASPTGLLVTQQDLIELCHVVHDFNGLFSSHIRHEGTGVFRSVNEVIEIGRKAKVPVDIIHIKIADQQYWGRMREVIDLVEQARHEGINVQSNVYPYTRGNNNLVSIIPPWAHEGGREALLKRLHHRQDRERMKQDIQKDIPGWYNHYRAVGGDWSRMLINADLSETNKQFEGQTMKTVIDVWRKDRNSTSDPLDILFDFLIQETGSISTIYGHHTEADMNQVMQRPWCSIGSDGSAYATEGPLKRGKPHPRNFGTFPRVLGVYVREQSLLTLEDAIRKMTSLNASKVGLLKRGTLKVGNFADITIFDAAEIQDQATYLAPFQYNRGIHYVIVNGKLVLKTDQHTGVLPGRSLRRGL